MIDADGARCGPEWPTVALFLGVYLAFGALTWLSASLPLWVLLPAGAYLVCLHSSMQHEALHGHPTRHNWLNAALVYPSLALWLPYLRYARLHRLHHRNELLTHPAEDPESYYLLPERWASLSAPTRLLYRLNNTLAGRLLLGPMIAVTRLVIDDIGRARGGERGIVAAWLLHVPAAAITLIWVVAVCEVPLWVYLLGFAYPGTSLMLLRSYLEHRAHEEVDARTAIVEAGPVMSLLYLNNNLHAAHHAEPGLAWYRLPAWYRQRRDQLLAANRGYRLDGYGAVARRYLLAAKESVVHPLVRS
jgi:fatty acid desaturase